jgi:hypothetical protein
MLRVELEEIMREGSLRAASLQEACRDAGLWNREAVQGMKLPVKLTPRAVVLFAFVALALTAGACGHDIGDDCKTSVDCDPNGTRSCDISQPGGYCTIAGCDETSCPSGSTCVRYFPVSLLPARSSAATSVMMCDPTGAPGACPAGQICSSSGSCAECDAAREDVTCDGLAHQNQCLADEVCLEVGLCAKQTFEQRECAKSCASNGDCRSGYDCRKAGEKGSMVLATNPLATTSFCAPHVP